MPSLEVRKQTGSRAGDAVTSPSQGRTGPPAAVCFVGSVWQRLNCLGPTVWELSQASPAWLRWTFLGSSAAVFFPCAGLAEHSHVAEGEQGDGRSQALSNCSSQPTSGSLMLPWQTALATWLLEPLFLVSGSLPGAVVPRSPGEGPALAPWH